MSLFKMLFWIFLIYLLIRFVRFSFYVGKIQSQVRKKYQSPEEEQKKEGTTTIKYIPEKDQITDNPATAKDDDYIDYEEVK